MEMLNANHRRKSKYARPVLLLMICLSGCASGYNLELTNGVNYEESFDVHKQNADETQPGDQTSANFKPQDGSLATMSSAEQDGDQDADIFVAEIFPDQPGGLEQLFKPLARYKKAVLGLDAQIEPSDLKEPYERDDSEFVVPALAMEKFGENIPGSTPMQDFTYDDISNGEDRLRNFEKNSRNLQDNKLEGQKHTGYNSYLETRTNSGSPGNEQNFKDTSSYKYPDVSGSQENKGEQEKYGIKARFVSYEEHKGPRGVQIKKGVNEGEENAHLSKSNAEMHTEGDNNLGNQAREQSKKTVAEQDEINRKEANRNNYDDYESSGSGEGSADGQEESGSGSIEGQAKTTTKDGNKNSAGQSKMRNLEPRNWGSMKDEVEGIKMGEREVKQENVTLVSEEDKKLQGSEKSAEKFEKDAEESKERILKNRNVLPANSSSKEQRSEANEIKRLDTGEEGSGNTEREKESSKDTDVTENKDLFASEDTNVGYKNNQSTLGSNTQLTSESKQITLGTSEQVSTNEQVINSSHTLHENLPLNRYMGNVQDNGVNKEIQQKRNSTGDNEVEKIGSELKGRQQDVAVEDNESNIGEKLGGKNISSFNIKNALENGAIEKMQRQNNSEHESHRTEAGQGREDLNDMQGDEQLRKKYVDIGEETEEETDPSLNIENRPKNGASKKMQNENNAGDETKGRKTGKGRNGPNGMQNDEELKDKDVDIEAKTGGKIVDIFVDNALNSKKDRETLQQTESNDKSQNYLSASEDQKRLTTAETKGINKIHDASQDNKHSNGLIEKSLQSTEAHNKTGISEEPETNIASRDDTSTSTTHKELEPTETKAINTTEGFSQDVKNSNILIEKTLPSTVANSGEETTEESGHEEAENTGVKEGISETSKHAGEASDGKVIKISLNKVSKQIKNETRTAKAQHHKTAVERNIEGGSGEANKLGEETGKEGGAPKTRGHETNENTNVKDGMVQRSQKTQEVSRESSQKTEEASKEGSQNNEEASKEGSLNTEEASKEGSQKTVEENRGGIISEDTKSENTTGTVDADSKSLENGRISETGSIKENQADFGMPSNSGSLSFRKKESMNEEHNTADDLKTSQNQNYGRGSTTGDEEKSDDFENMERFQRKNETANQLDNSKAREDKKVLLQQKSTEHKDNEQDGLVTMSKDDLLKTRLTSEEAARKLFLSIVHRNDTDEKEKKARMKEKIDQPANIDHRNSSSIEKSDDVNMVDKTDERQLSTAKEKSPQGKVTEEHAADGKQRESSGEQEVSETKEAMNMPQEDKNEGADNEVHHDENVSDDPKQDNKDEGMFTNNERRLAAQSGSNENEITRVNITSFSKEGMPKKDFHQNENYSQQGNEDQGKLNDNEGHSAAQASGNENAITSVNMTSYNKKETPEKLVQQKENVGLISQQGNKDQGMFTDNEGRLATQSGTNENEITRVNMTNFRKEGMAKKAFQQNKNVGLISQQGNEDQGKLNTNEGHSTAQASGNENAITSVNMTSFSEKETPEKLVQQKENVGLISQQGNKDQGMLTDNEGRLATQSESNENEIAHVNMTNFSKEETPKKLDQQKENVGLSSQQGNEDQGKLKANEGHSAAQSNGNENFITRVNMTNFSKEETPKKLDQQKENVGLSSQQGNEDQGKLKANGGQSAAQSSGNENFITRVNMTNFSKEETPKKLVQQKENVGLSSQQGNEDQGKLNTNEGLSSNEKDVTHANMTSFSKEDTPREQFGATESPMNMMELNSTNVTDIGARTNDGANESVASETREPARQLNNPLDKVTEQLFGVKLQDDSTEESDAENRQLPDKIGKGNETRSEARVILKVENANTARQQEEMKQSSNLKQQKDQSTLRQNSKTKNASKPRQKPIVRQQSKERQDTKGRQQSKGGLRPEERQQTEVRLQNKGRQRFGNKHQSKNKQRSKTKKGTTKLRSRKQKKHRHIHGNNLDFSTMLMSQKARELYMNLIHDTSQALMTKKRHKNARRRHFQTHSKLSPFMTTQHLRASHNPLGDSTTMQYSKSKTGKNGNAVASVIEPVKGVHELASKLLNTMMENDQKLIKQTAFRTVGGKMETARKHNVAEKLDTPSSLIGKLAELKFDVNLDKKENEVPTPHSENNEDASLKEATFENENPGKTVMQKQKGGGLSSNVDLDTLDGNKQEYEYKVLDAKIEGELAKSEDETSKGEDIGELASKQRNASTANLTQPVARANPSIGNLSVYNTEESLGSEARDYQNEANDDMNEKMYLKQKDVKQFGDFGPRKNETNVMLGRKLKDMEEGMIRKNEKGLLRLEHGKNFTVSWHRHPSLYFDGNSSLWKNHDVVSMDIDPLVDVFYKVNHENLVDLVEHPELVRKEQKTRVKGTLRGHQKISRSKGGARKINGRHGSKHRMQSVSKQLKSKQITRLQQWIQRMQLLSKQRAITTQSEQMTDSTQSEQRADSTQLDESKQRTLSEPWAQLKQRPLQGQRMLSEPWKQRKDNEAKANGETHHRRKQMKKKGSKAKGQGRKNRKMDSEKDRADEERKVGHVNKERKMGQTESERQMGHEKNNGQMGHAESERQMGHEKNNREMGHAKEKHKMGYAESERRMGREKNDNEMGHAKDENKMGLAKEERKMGHAGQVSKMNQEVNERKTQQADDDDEYEMGHTKKELKVGSQEIKHTAGKFDRQRHKVNAKNKKILRHHYRHKHKKPVQGTAKFGISGSEQSASSPQEPKFKNNMPANVKYFLIENAAKRGALCIDGSTPGYYLRRGFGTGEKNWIIHLHGGAWCYDAQTCYRRSFSILGSTNHWSAENITNFFQGFLSDKKEVNPYFHNWNVVVQTYCDGGLFSGKRKEPLEINGRKLYFRGRPILKALVESLKRRNLESAADIILSGTSAGGLAVLLQGDYLKHRLPKTATVRGLVDAGFFLDSPSQDGSNVVENQFKGLFDIHRPKLRMKCENGKDNNTKYQCLFPQQTILHTKLPVYFVNALYDHWQLSELQRLHCVYNNDNCIPEQRDRILNFRNVMYEHLLDALGHMKHAGLFADSCIGHGQVIVDYTWTRIRVNNQTISDAFHDWFNDRSGKRRHINTDCRYPCNGSCPKAMVRSCIKNFKGASNKFRTKRSAELC